MIPVDAATIDAVTRHHAPRWTVRTSDGQDWSRLVKDGEITRTSAYTPRTKLRLTLAESGSPGLIDQGMLPTGRDVIVSYRIHPDPAEIVIFTGRLISSPLRRPDSEWRLDATDHAGMIQTDLTDPSEWPMTPGTVGDLVTAIVHRTLPNAAMDITGAALTAPMPTDLKLDDDPWQIIETACTSCGAEAWFDHAGVCVVRDEPLIDAPVDALRVGDLGSVTGYQLHHMAGYSVVQLRYEDKEDPPNRVTGLWTDTRPDSPTSVDRIGRVVLRKNYGGLLGLPDQARADQAAAAMAARMAGHGRRAEIRHIPRPWIMPGDSIEVTMAGGPTEVQMVESVTIPIGPDVQVTALRNYEYKVEAA